MKKREFMFCFQGNPDRNPIMITAWDIGDAIEQTHMIDNFPDGHVMSVNNRTGKPTIVDFQED